MGIADFFQTHIVGNHFDLNKWSIREISIVLVKTQFLLIIIFYYNFLIIFKRLLICCLDCSFISKIIQCKKMILLKIPILNKQLRKLNTSLNANFYQKFLPAFDKFILVFRILIYKNLIELILVNPQKANIKIHFTKESEQLHIFKDKQLLTTLLISNHRSICDYLLICYISLYQTQYISPYDTNWAAANKVWESSIEEIPQVAFISWGDIIVQPTRKFLWNIIFKDENRVVTSKTLTKYLTKNGNRLFVIFPEVNIITTELSLIQRKLNQDYYPYVAKYYNVLYPRFGNWTHILSCFKQLSMKYPKDSRNDDRDKIKLNRFFYQLTIVYYNKITLYDAHDHNKGGIKALNALNIQELIPSLFEMVQVNNCTQLPPISIQMTLTKEEITTLLPKTTKKWERLLETRWNRIEGQLQDFEMSLTSRVE